jgi:hypothetical protein
MEMGRETARVVFGGRSINVYNKVKYNTLYSIFMLLNDPLCTTIKKLSRNGGFTPCAQKSVANIAAP